MNVLMLYPKYPRTFWNAQKPARLFYRRSASMPPLGLLTVASYLPDDFQVRLVDRNLAEETEADWQWADVVFLSLMAVQRDDYRECVERARQRGKPIAVGGPYAHCRPDQVTADADWVCIGEAEPVMDEFVADLRAGRKGRVYHSERRTDMASVRAPRFELLGNLNRYFVIPVEFSRGCPYQCEFCEVIEFNGRVPRPKAPGQLTAELAQLKRLGFCGLVMVTDDNFGANRAVAKQQLRELTAWNRANGSPFTYFVEASVNIGDDDELLSAMREAGILFVFVGIETPDPKLLRTAHKPQNLTGDLMQRIGRIREHGMHVLAGLIVGFDGETPEVFDIQRQFIRDSAIAVASPGLLIAIAHTALWRRLVAEERLIDLPMNIEQTVSGINFIPKGEITRRQYLLSYSQLFEEVFSPEAYFERSRKALLQTRMRCTLRPNLRTLRLVVPSTLRRIWVLGIRNKETRRHYLKTLATVLLRNPSAIEAFGFDAYFYLHLREHADYVKKTLRGYLDSPLEGDVLDSALPATSTTAPS